MRYSIANISGKPLSIDGLEFKEGERLDDLENVSDEVRKAEARGEVQVMQTPRLQDHNAQNLVPAPAAQAPSPAELEANDGVITNDAANGQPKDAEGARQDPTGSGAASSAQQDVSVSDQDQPNSVSDPALKDPISKDNEGKTFADFSKEVDQAEASKADDQASATGSGKSKK